MNDIPNIFLYFISILNISRLTSHFDNLIYTQNLILLNSIVGTNLKNIQQYKYRDSTKNLHLSVKYGLKIKKVSKIRNTVIQWRNILQKCLL